MSSNPVLKSVYEFEDYRRFLVERTRADGAPIRGEMQRLAKTAQIHTSTLSLVFAGKRELTEEQAVRAGRHFGLARDELRYFLRLVLLARSGSGELREIYAAELEKMRGAREKLARRLPVVRFLPAEQNAVFYSNWYYSAVRIVSSIDGYQTPPAIAERLAIPVRFVEEAAEFLVANGLCEKRNGKLRPGPQSTHLKATSPHIARHHANWRVRSMLAHPTLDADRELAYSGALSLSREDAREIKRRVLAFVEEVCRRTDDSPAEEAYCLNLDWFRI